MIGWLPYILLFILLLPLSFLYPHVGKKQKKGISLICIVFLCLFFGLHGEMGEDWHIYHTIYENDTWLSVLDFVIEPLSVKMMEPGFVILMMICRSLGIPFQGFMFLFAVITLSLLYRFLLYYSTNIPLSLLLFLIFGGIFLEVVFLRSSIALLLFLNSIPFIESNRPKAFLALNILGTCFHVSALLYLPCYFLYKMNIPIRWYVSICVCSLIICMAHVRIATFVVYSIDWALGNDVQFEPFQLAEIDDSVTIPLGAIERVLTAVAIMINMDKLLLRGSGVVFFANSYLLYFVFSFFLWDIPIINDRFAIMFIYAYWIIWPILPEFVSINWKKKLLIVIMTTYCSFRMISIIFQPSFLYTLP